MINLCKRVLAGLWGCVGLLLQVSCGGGAEPAAQSLPQTIAFTAPGEQDRKSTRLNSSHSS